MLSAWQNLRPLPRAALTSCALMSLGDVCCQCIQKSRAQQPLQLDLGRAARFGLVGLTLHGPFFYKGFQWLDARFGREPTFRNAITKSLAGQATLFPSYTTLFILYASLLEGNSIQQGVELIKERFPTLVLAGTAYWPVVNMLNFKYVHPSQRVLAVNACSILWNTYLSYISSGPSPAK